MASQILDVSIATAYLRQMIETDDLLGDCWIRGEVSERFEAKSGHIYFTLLEGQSALKSVIFRGNALRQRRPFRDGDQVVAHGRFSIYEQRSTYQLIADSVQPAGLGIQALQLELLRQKLEAEGLFDESRKRPLPAMPKTIGVVTSVDGAVWHDIQTVLRRRYPLAHLLLSPASVQGETAPAGIVTALDRLIADGRAEVIVIGRGGGAAEDLAAFNDERVVRAIFASPIPTVSAIGHETDWTLSDLVSDLRAPTPSAAAEIVSPSLDELASYVAALEAHQRSTVLADMAGKSIGLTRFADAMQRHSPRRDIDRLRPRLGHAVVRIVAAGHTNVERIAARTEALAAGGRHQWSLAGAAQESRLSIAHSALRTLEPRSVLNRGFAFVSHAETGLPIRSVHDAEPGESATIGLRDGDIAATVNAIHPSRT